MLPADNPSATYIAARRRAFIPSLIEASCAVRRLPSHANIPLLAIIETENHFILRNDIKLFPLCQYRFSCSYLFFNIDILGSLPHCQKSARPPRQRAKFMRWIPQACAYWRMLHCLPCSSRVDRLARRRLSKQKGQASEMISGLAPRWKTLLNRLMNASVFLIKSMLIL